MKVQIHPKWYETKVTCAGCGNSFSVGSTMPEIHIEVCSNCHPFYTGEMRFIDTAGRVDRFKEKQQMAGKARLSKKERRAQKRTQKIEDELSKPTTLEEIRKA